MSKYFFVIVLLLFSSVLYPQSLSPLIPYLTNNQLLSRPKVLRDMQDEMTKNKNIDKGLKINDLSESFNKLIDSVKDFYLFKIDTTKDSLIISSRFLNEPYKIKKEELIKINKINFPDSIKKRINDSLNIYLSKLISNFNPSVQTIIINGLIIIFSSDNSEYSIDLKDINSEDNRKNTLKLSELIKNYIFNKIEGYEINNGKNEKQKDALDSVTLKLINHIFEDTDSKVKDKIITKIKTIQNYLENEMNEISDWLLAGNMGLGISKTEGEFTGGIQISYNLSSTFQSGLFLNSNFKDKSDSVVTKPGSLFGFQSRFATDNLQLDGLISCYFGDKNFRSFKNFEFGFGISTKIKSIILGLSYFNLRNYENGNGYTKIQNAGIYLKTSSKQSPTLYLGIIKDSDDWGNFSVKIIYPIIAL